MIRIKGFCKVVMGRVGGFSGSLAAFSFPLLLASALAIPLSARQPQHEAEEAGESNPLFDAMQYRSIGPFRGGRAAACTGVPGKPMTFLFGSTGGGVWQTDNAGATWRNISDGYFGGSIGAVAVAPSDPNILFVGTGETTVRGNVSHGNGVWKSTDGGKTWTHMGLEDSRHISRIRIDSRNPDLVYVAALGHLFGPNQQRGVFRSRDGGKNWERILFVSENAGAADLVIDPSNPRVLFASLWQVRRTPHSLESGGPDSGLWKSTDGGDTWKDISRSDGLPGNSVLGIIGVSVSPVNSERVWALVEAADGGLFRSDNGGSSWRKVNEDRNLRQRAWYYTRVYADTKNVDKVYVVNVSFLRSDDAGKTFESIATPHGDHHDLWIDPEVPERMVVADDGGAQVSLNAGVSWSTYMNQPTAQFYRVVTDNHYPYRIYGAQQDNSTVRIASRSDGGSISERDWEPTAGGESGHIAPHPTDPDTVFGGSYGGYLSRYNHRTREDRDVNAWPDNPIGRAIRDVKYRFQWNFPIFFSPHDNNTLYTAANVLFRSTDLGQSWEVISPDLTRDDDSRQASSGGPITQDNTGVEVYCTIFAAAESPLEKGLLWTGSDDGLIHVSRDSGANWKNVTPPQMPEWTQVNSIEVHPTIPGGLYVAATRYKLDDFRPYLFKTTDYGETWTEITAGIDSAHFTRVIRADPKRAGLLFAGTESGMYISFDDGASWQTFQLNLPIVPITDLAIKNDDLVVATQGRSFWILDDLTPLHQWDNKILKQPTHLFSPRPVVRGASGSGRASAVAGANPASGVPVRFWLRDVPEDSVVAVRIKDSTNQAIRVWSTRPDEKLGEEKLNLKAGINSIVWNRRYPEATTFEGMILWGGGTQGPEAIPGKFRVELAAGEQTLEHEFEILPDPRKQVTAAEYDEQFKFLLQIRDKLSETHKAIKTIRDVRGQLDDVRKRLEASENEERKKLAARAGEIISRLTTIEETLYQTKSRSGQDPLNFPIRLNNRLSALAGVVASGDGPPTRQSREVHDMVVAEIDQNLAALRKVFDEDVAGFNNTFREQGVPAVFIESGK